MDDDQRKKFQKYMQGETRRKSLKKKKRGNDHKLLKGYGVHKPSRKQTIWYKRTDKTKRNKWKGSSGGEQLSRSLAQRKGDIREEVVAGRGLRTWRTYEKEEVSSQEKLQKKKGG